jgi:hypothetical protein
MNMNKHLGGGLGLIVALGTACPGGDDSADDTSSETGDTSASGTGTDSMSTSSAGTMSTTSTDTGMDTGTDDTGTGMCLGTGGPNAVGDACTSNDDCASGVCTIYTDVPLNEDAVCAETPPDCNTRLTGTVFDFTTLEPVASETVRVVPALQAITNPEGAMAVIEATSGDDGRVDATSSMPINAAIAIVAIAGGSGDTFLTATGLASAGPSNAYEVGVGNHDLWVVPSASLTEWSTALMGDPDIDADAQLPLGENGGIVGLVRDDTGAAVVGATVQPEADSSAAVIRYLGDDGSFNDVATESSGIFVIFGAPTTGETFEAVVNDEVVGSQLAGSAAGVVFTLILGG